jgi:uncharacterized protein
MVSLIWSSAMKQDEIYSIRDPIYGFINFNELERKIIAHSAFQRLRRIRQLGIADMVYPGAVHTRFEHSLGVMHLATLMYDAMLQNSNNKRILMERLSYRDPGFERDRQLIRLAALLHDIGHAPFSHASENIMPLNQQGKPYTHEDYTAAIIVNSSLKDVIENDSFNKSNLRITAKEIAALIEGDPFLGEKLFWKVLISSQLDADRGDYLLRDSHHVGVKYGIYDHLMLINTLALGIEPESDEIVLGIDENGWHVAESLVIARYQMFTQVYFHKTVRAYQYHLEEAMKSVLSGGKLPDMNDLSNYTNLDDTDMWGSFKENHEDINCKSIFDRNHIRLVYSTPETPTPADEAKKDQELKNLADNSIWFYEDNKARKSWYKLNNKDDRLTEIMIVNDGKAKPLSNYSLIVKNMKGVNQIRLYVRHDDRERARGLLNG